MISDVASSSQAYQSGDFFDASAFFDQWQAFALVRWLGSDGRYYCDLFTNEDDLQQRTGSRAFTPEEIDAGMELCGGPTCRAEIERDRAARAQAGG